MEAEWKQPLIAPLASSRISFQSMQTLGSMERTDSTRLALLALRIQTDNPAYTGKAKQAMTDWPAEAARVVVGAAQLRGLMSILSKCLVSVSAMLARAEAEEARGAVPDRVVKVVDRVAARLVYLSHLTSPTLGI